MARSIRYFGLCCSVAACVGVCCGGAAPGGEAERIAGMRGTLKIAGTAASIPVVKEAAARIMRLGSNVRIVAEAGRCDAGLEKLGRGVVAVAVVPDHPGPELLARYGLVCFPFALDGVAVIVHPANPISNLRSAQARDIFTGRTKKWNDITGVAGPARWIRLYTREQGSASRALFGEKILPGGSIAATAAAVLSDGQMKNAVAADRDAIGYVSLGHVEANCRTVALDGIAPSRRNALAGVYCVAQKLTINTKGEPAALASAFIDFLNGKEGTKILAAQGYVPLK